MSDICNLDMVKDYLGMQGAKQLDDDLITDLCGRVTKQFENYCGVTSFNAADFVEYHNGCGSKHLFPNANLPINSITTIHDDPEWTWGSDTLIAATDYRIVDSKYIVAQTNFTDNEQNVKVVFNAGYTNIPEDLLQSAIEETGRKYKHRLDFDVLNKVMTDGTVQYVDPGLMKSTVQILKFYKNAWVV